MKTSKILIISAVALFAIFSLNSCKETGSDTQNELIQSSKDEAVADDLFDDLSFQADLYQEATKSDCPVVTVSTPDTAMFPRHIEIDFGDSCVSSFGRVRSGKIIIDQTDRCYVEGAVRTITLENYYVNGYKIEGTKTMVNDGVNEQNFIQHTITLAGGKITTPEGQVITRDAVHTREWIAGDTTLFNFYDDKWRITGTAEGVNRFGNSYTSVTTLPLIFDMSCMFKLVEGLITITTDNHIITVDYGSGECDNVATVTVDGVSNTIEFR